MERRGQAQGRATGRRGFASRLGRLGSLLSLAVVAIFTLSGCGDDNSVYSTISPRTDNADDIQFLYKVVFWMALVVFVGVQAGIVYTVLRYRRRSDDDVRPEQLHGNKTLEIVWTIIPAVVLLVIFIPTVSTLYDFDRASAEGEYVVEVYGKQWWWEIHYKEPDSVAEVITANEIRIPAGKKVQIKLYSNNVIHSFWVPQLTGKMDVMPGHENRLGFTADKPGVYYGECAEFCGEQHAWMRFKVIVEPQEQFDSWIAAWNAGPSQQAAAISGDIAKVPASVGLCLSCHRVNGTDGNFAPIGLDQDEETSKIAGPNLTLFGCRTTIAAGLLENTPENLARWLEDPDGVKPGNHMATAIKEGTLQPGAINEIVLYLESLIPEGGCAAPTGENADIVAAESGD